jgi:GNAT superfamily N-acetyltransferase
MQLIKFYKNVMLKAPNEIPNINVKDENITVKIIKPEDLMNESSLYKRRVLFKRLLKKGHVGIMLEDDINKKCIGYGWIAINSAKIGHLNILPHNSAWLHTGVVNKEYRGHGYFKLIMKKRIEYIRKLYKDMDIYVDAYYKNTPARKTHKALNFIEAGMYYYFSIGTLRIPYFYLGIGKWLKEKKHPPIEESNRNKNVLTKKD